MWLQCAQARYPSRQLYLAPTSYQLVAQGTFVLLVAIHLVVTLLMLLVAAANRSAQGLESRLAELLLSRLILMQVR